MHHFLPFYPFPPKNPKNQNFEKIKKVAGGIIILHVYQKSRLYDVWFLRYGAQQTECFCHFGPFTVPLPH